MISQIIIHIPAITKADVRWCWNLLLRKLLPILHRQPNGGFVIVIKSEIEMSGCYLKDILSADRNCGKCQAPQIRKIQLRNMQINQFEIFSFKTYRIIKSFTNSTLRFDSITQWNTRVHQLNAQGYCPLRLPSYDAAKNLPIKRRKNKL